ncbi:ferrochelatase [Brachybacterium sp. JHP9]|uniref:Coproporphyrin III ferrochelatase n=1 Tax=Brachybacterium equifaecis TaxID=2910770 RepID=A0ABT0QXY2_9MICO|nr:ferrochelatase [Brachybacterium equifaecis]MCL6422471.1 ferrochelatase [Brachybacterium equifaecis]
MTAPARPAGPDAPVPPAADVIAPLVPGTEADTHGRRAQPLPADAIVFASFGGPEGPEDVMPFLRNVTRGRGIPDERLEEVSHHYMAMGGRSPINAQNRTMIAQLEAALAERGIDLPVYWGNRNWEPYMADAVRSLHADGHRRALGIVTSAYSSYSSCRQYREDFGKALVETGLLGEVTIDKIRVYFDHPGFLDPVADGLAEALGELRAEGHEHSRIRVLFSTHSIPTAMAVASGPEETRGGSCEGDPEGTGGWYVAQHLAACRYVMEQVAASPEGSGAEAPAWELVYQSRSGAPHIPWLEPDINDVIEGIAAERSADAVVVVPIGFVTDHVEVVWDLDTEAKESAEEAGLGFRRVATSGSDPRFIAALVDLVEERLREDAPRRQVTDFGGTPDVCGVGCCANGSPRARIQPTTSALDSPADVAAAAADAGAGAAS